jgi:hypothetical protein
VTIAGDDAGSLPVAFDDELVEVAGLSGLQPIDGQVIDNGQLDGVQFAHVIFVADVQSRAAQAFKQFVGTFCVHAVVTPHGDIP